jgi:hypothetical protein
MKSVSSHVAPKKKFWSKFIEQVSKKMNESKKIKNKVELSHDRMNVNKSTLNQLM